MAYISEKAKDLQEDVKDSAYKIWLAGIGALSIAGEEGSKLFKNLVDKGQQFEVSDKIPVDSVKQGVTSASDQAGVVFRRMEEFINEKVAVALKQFGVPTREEINTLTERVEALMDAISKLNEAEKTDKA